MPMKDKTRYHKEWKRMRNANIKEYEEEFEPRPIKRNRGGYIKAKERSPIVTRRKTY